MFYLDTGDDLREAESIIQHVFQRTRRVLGPAHPDTLRVEGMLSYMREEKPQSEEQLEGKIRSNSP